MVLGVVEKGVVKVNEVVAKSGGVTVILYLIFIQIHKNCNTAMQLHRLVNQVYSNKIIRNKAKQNTKNC